MTQVVFLDQYEGEVVIPIRERTEQDNYRDAFREQLEVVDYQELAQLMMRRVGRTIQSPHPRGFRLREEGEEPRETVLDEPTLRATTERLIREAFYYEGVRLDTFLRNLGVLVQVPKLWRSMWRATPTPEQWRELLSGYFASGATSLAAYSGVLQSAAELYLANMLRDVEVDAEIERMINEPEEEADDATLSS